jgi:DNA mismatch repair ATPase MutS
MTFNRAGNSGQAFQRYTRLLDIAAGVKTTSPLLADLHAALHAEGVVASAAVRRFARIADWSNLRYSAALLYLLIQATTLWDFHVVAALESWQVTYGRRVRAWLQTLAELEALDALAGFAHDNPSFAFPDVKGHDSPIFAARALGHPMIAEGVRVANDVTIGPPGTFLLVTGSNMSGKSTLLRAIGVNAVLAHAGGPVCAATLELTPVRLHTSMRVHDSLAQGLSYFMAALTRLKTVVDASRGGVATPLLYLLDEILQGTNSAERQIAVRRIIAFLLKQHAIGAVTTHDLELANAEPIASQSIKVHFTENFRIENGRRTMYFGYRLQPGLATSSNALTLLEMVGLALPADGLTE